MSAPFYSYDPCARTGAPCGACFPHSNKPCVASNNDLRPCSMCPGGGCSPCPAPVRPCPAMPPPCPVLPCSPPCAPCFEPPPPPHPKPNQLPDTIAIPCCRPNRCKPCPCYCSPRPICYPKPCYFPGVPVCGACGPCMPVG